MTDLGVAAFCVVFFLLILALCALAHVMDQNEIMAKRLKELEK